MPIVTLQKLALLSALVAFIGNVSCAVAETPLRVGVIAPLSGFAQELGVQLKNGIELAREGYSGSLDVIYEDDACDPQAAVSAARKLTAVEHVDVVIGPLCSPSFIAVGPVFENAGVPYLHASSGTPSTFASCGHWGIEGSSTVMEENERLSEYIIRQGFRSAAVLHMEQEWATGHANSFVKAFSEHGGVILDRQSFTDSLETDFRTQLLKIKRAHPGVVFLALVNQHLAIVLKQIAVLHLDIPIFSQYDMEDPSLLRAAGPTAEGVRYTYPFDNEHLSMQQQAFAKRYQEQYSLAPSFYPFNGHDLLALMLHAFATCHTDHDCLHDTIVSTQNFPGLSGPISFDNGAIHRNFVIKTVQDSHFRIIERPDPSP